VTLNPWRCLLPPAAAPFALLLALSAGCTTPDQWGVFEQPKDRETEAEETQPFELPPEVKPRPEHETPMPPMKNNGPMAVSIEQAVLLALSHNRDLVVKQFEPVIAGAFEWIERGRYDPELFASAEYTKEQTSETDRGTSDQFSVDSRDTEAEVGIRLPLPTGTKIEATVGTDRSISNRAPEQQQARLGITVTQALLRGFGPSVNLASIRQAKYKTLESRYILRAFAEALLAETETAYWNYVLAHERIAIFERSLQVAKQQLDVVEQRIEVGVLARTEAAAARTETARREQALIEARSNLESARLRLLRLMNPCAGHVEAFAREIIATSGHEIKPEPIENLADRAALADKMRPEINAARLRLEQRRLETVVTRNGLLPRLDAFVVLGRSGFDNTFKDSFRNLNEDTYDFKAGVSFSYFIGNRAARGRDLAALASRRQAAEALDNLRQIIRLDVHLAVNEAERARRQITASATTRELEEQTVKAELERFDVGASTALLVAQAQRDLLAAQIVEVESVVAYRIALVNLYLAEGTLLERRGIQLE